MEEIELIKYPELLNRIEKTENHLLIANGFNRGLGINTSYYNIFQEMKKENSIYNDIEELMIKVGYDLEHLLGELDKSIVSNNTFLSKYVKNNIKLDFMQATQKIVSSNIKNIYSEKNDGIFLLLKHFTNFFTLNYDSFLYNLLLKYKPNEKNTLIDGKNDTFVMPARLKFKEDSMNIEENNIYLEIKNLRDNGKLQIIGAPAGYSKDLNCITKSHLVTSIVEYGSSNNRGWTKKNIEKVVKYLIENENQDHVLKKVDDGSEPLDLFAEMPEFSFRNKDTQNLFFLHGAFHIYQKDGSNRKITQTKDKALYNRLADILNTDGQDIVCVFQSSNKAATIEGNEYLNNGLNKLQTLSGNLVIIGSSLDENDSHVFDKINDSHIQTVYISVLEKDKLTMYQKAQRAFPNKELVLFDAGSITYDV